MLDLSEFLKRRKSQYQKKLVRLEKTERNTRAILDEEPDRQDVKESLQDLIKWQDRYSALLDFIEELQDEYFVR